MTLCWLASTIPTGPIIWALTGTVFKGPGGIGPDSPELVWIRALYRRAVWRGLRRGHLHGQKSKPPFPLSWGQNS